MLYYIYAKTGRLARLTCTIAGMNGLLARPVEKLSDIDRRGTLIISDEERAPRIRGHARKLGCSINPKTRPARALLQILNGLRDLEAACRAGEEK